MSFIIVHDTKEIKRYKYSEFKFKKTCTKKYVSYWVILEEIPKEICDLKFHDVLKISIQFSELKAGKNHKSNFKK